MMGSRIALLTLVFCLLQATLSYGAVIVPIAQDHYLYVYEAVSRPATSDTYRPTGIVPWVGGAGVHGFDGESGSWADAEAGMECDLGPGPASEFWFGARASASNTGFEPCRATAHFELDFQVDQDTSGDFGGSLTGAVTSMALSDTSGPMANLTGSVGLTQTYDFVAGMNYKLVVETVCHKGDSGGYYVELVVPEPTIVCLLLAGGLAALRWKRR